jgi:hypothetical protein
MPIRLGRVAGGSRKKLIIATMSVSVSASLQDVVGLRPDGLRRTQARNLDGLRVLKGTDNVSRGRTLRTS